MDDGTKFLVGMCASFAFWVLMAGIAQSDVGAMIGFVLAFALAMFVAPIFMLGPIGPLAGFVAVTAYIAKMRKKASDWGPFVAVHLLGFVVFAWFSLQSLQRMWP